MSFSVSNPSYNSNVRTMHQRPSLHHQHPPDGNTVATEQVKHTAELSENDKFLRLTMDLPGVFARDLEVDVSHGVLSIKGIRRTMSINHEVCLKKQKFMRRYGIDTDVVDVSAITANLALGVLTILAPKKKRAPTKLRIGVTENPIECRDESTANTPSMTSNPDILVTTEPPVTAGENMYPGPVAVRDDEASPTSSLSKSDEGGDKEAQSSVNPQL